MGEYHKKSGSLQTVANQFPSISRQSRGFVDNRNENIHMGNLIKTIEDSSNYGKSIINGIDHKYTTLQRQITMKDKGTLAERSSGDGDTLIAEVEETITKNKPSDMLETIAQLTQSILSREEEQKRFKRKDNPALYDSHIARIDLEKKLLKQLSTAYSIDLARRRAKRRPRRGPDKDGWFTA